MATAAFIERQNRVRGALHCYLRITISNLPAFSDFSSMNLIGLEHMYNGLNDIGTFDAQNLSTLSTASGLLGCWKDWTTDFRKIQSPREEYSTIEDYGRENLYYLSREILAGSIFHSILRETIKRLGNYDISLQRAQEVFENWGIPFWGDRFHIASTMSKLMQEELRRHLEKLEHDPKNLDLIRRAGIVVLYAKRFLKWTEESLIPFAELFEKVLSTINLTEPPSEAPEEPQVMGDLRDHENGD
jgi:hypothetical protein